MAKYPDTHNRFPVTPKAYPGTRNAFPVSPKAYPSASTASFDPRDLSGCIAWTLMSRDVTTASASLTSGLPSNAAWTKNDCTCVATGTGNQSQITVGVAPTDAYVTITPTGAATGALCVNFIVTFWVSYQNIPWVILETRAATANNRAAFNIQTGVIQTPALNMQDSTITAETRNGVAGYRVSSTCWANGGAMIVRIHASTAATLTVPAAGTTMLIDDVTVSQVRAASHLNFVTSTAFTPPSVDTQPGYVTDTIIPCIRGYGGQYAHSTEAALVARFAHGAGAPFPSYSFAALCSLRDSDANYALFGWGLSSTATNHSGYLGQNTTGTGSYIVVARNASTADNVESVDTPVTSVGVFGVTYDGTTGTTRIYWNGVEVAAYVGDQLQNLVTITPDRVSDFSRPGSTPLVPFIGDLYERTLWNVVRTAPEMVTVAAGMNARVA